MSGRLTQSFRQVAGAFIMLAVLRVATMPAAAETSSEKVDAFLRGSIGADGPGVAVLVAQNGKILFEKGYGLADIDQHVPIWLVYPPLPWVARQFAQRRDTRLHQLSSEAAR